jgi:hypothetical protein
MKHWLKLATLALALAATTACEKSATPPDDDDTTIIPPPPPPTGGTATLVAAGNIAVCSNTNDDATARLIDAMTTATVVALGDNAFPDGTLANYNDCYGPSWGRFKDRTYAVVGNHDYDSSATAEGTLSYFGERAGPPGKGYYSFDIGTWHVVVLNSNGSYVPFNATSEQQAWLASDLQANASKRCIMAIWHHGRYFSSSSAGGLERTTQASLWSRLYSGGVDVILNGDAHFYERLRPMLPDGTVDEVNGMVQFAAGTGGESVTSPSVVHPNSAHIATVFGVVRFTLKDGSYDWAFVPAVGPEGDAGTASCR